jgi:hypothetical protein
MGATSTMLSKAECGRCRAQVTPARSPCRAHAACVPRMQQRHSISRTLLSQHKSSLPPPLKLKQSRPVLAVGDEAAWTEAGKQIAKVAFMIAGTRSDMIVAAFANRSTHKLTQVSKDRKQSLQQS